VHERPSTPVDIGNPAAWRWRGPAVPVESANAPAEVAPLLAKLEETNQDQLILRLVAGSPGVFRPFVLFADGLVNRGAFPAEDREVLVLHVGASRALPYEWHSHLGPASDAGLSEAQVEALGAGPPLDPSLFTPAQLLTVELTDRLLEHREWTDDDWARAVATWGPVGALELVLCIGWWGGIVALTLGALDLRPDPPT
jgi:alkylhydroperoxidase family enzyme